MTEHTETPPRVGDLRRERQIRRYDEAATIETDILVNDKILVYTRTGGWVDIREVVDGFDASES